MVSKEELINLCERGIVPVNKWRWMDSHSAQEQLAHCWMLLRAGCEFTIFAKEDTRIYVRISHPTFDTVFEELPYKQSDFYVPTNQRLKEVNGEDWH